MAFLAALLFKPSAPAAPKITTAQTTPPPAPPPPPPPPAPAVAIDGEDSEGAAREQALIKKRRGQASTILTSPLGVSSPAPQPTTLGGR